MSAFTKMHGLGNDFVVLDARLRPFAGDPATVRRMGDRNRGIGFDQLLVLLPPVRPGASAGLRIWNQDGSRAGQCGNGLRCVGAWLARDGALVPGAGGILEVDGRPLRVVVHALTGMQAEVEAEMGEPVFGAAAVGLRGDSTVDVDGRTLAPALVSMGNPHAVLEVGDLTAPALEVLGPALTSHRDFAQGVNAGFVQVRDAARVALRVHERGAGWTAACGSGACAAVAALRRQGRVDEDVQVSMPGGTLQVRWPGPGAPLWLRGPASFVFEGRWPDDAAA